ncbi:MAG: phosphonate metabolism transcriptional regulator PhnF [Thalassobaculaceae bacterium]|nr:phosphonate metabolism transcriptional regulator PhnF [Thalassobaculaceae bacterium]
MVDLDRKGGRNLWAQIGEALAEEIIAGIFAPGARLPTEPALMARFQVSRHTVRQALADLEARGLVRAEQGRGTFVHRLALTYGISERTRFTQNLSDQGYQPAAELLEHSEIAAPDAVAADLGLAAGTPVIRRRGLSRADGVPVELADSYYPAARFPKFAEMRTRLTGISEAFAAYGITDYRRVSTEVGARLPSAEEARLLRQPKSQPVLTIRKIDVDMDGTAICVAQSIWPAERVTFAVQAPRDGGTLTRL